MASGAFVGAIFGFTVALYSNAVSTSVLAVGLEVMLADVPASACISLASLVASRVTDGLG